MMCPNCQNCQNEIKPGTVHETVRFHADTDKPRCTVKSVMPPGPDFHFICKNCTKRIEPGTIHRPEPLVHGQCITEQGNRESAIPKPSFEFTCPVGITTDDILAMRDAIQHLIIVTREIKGAILFEKEAVDMMERLERIGK